jgi:hypothetical protein
VCLHVTENVSIAFTLVFGFAKLYVCVVLALDLKHSWLQANEAVAPKHAIPFTTGPDGRVQISTSKPPLVMTSQNHVRTATLQYAAVMPSTQQQQLDELQAEEYADENDEEEHHVRVKLMKLAQAEEKSTHAPLTAPSLKLATQRVLAELEPVDVPDPRLNVELQRVHSFFTQVRAAPAAEEAPASILPPDATISAALVTTLAADRAAEAAGFVARPTLLNYDGQTNVTPASKALGAPERSVSTSTAAAGAALALLEADECLTLPTVSIQKSVSAERTSGVMASTVKPSVAALDITQVTSTDTGSKKKTPRLLAQLVSAVQSVRQAADRATAASVLVPQLSSGSKVSHRGLALPTAAVQHAWTTELAAASAALDGPVIVRASAVPAADKTSVVAQIVDPVVTSVLERATASSDALSSSSITAASASAGRLPSVPAKLSTFTSPPDPTRDRDPHSAVCA